MELPDRHYPTNAVIGYMNDWTISQKARKVRPLFEASPRERDAAFAALSKKVAIKQARKDKHQLFEAIVQVNSRQSSAPSFFNSPSWHLRWQVCTEA